MADADVMYDGMSLVNPNRLSLVVYNLLGTPIMRTSDTSVPMSWLPVGIYIIRTPSRTIKILKQ